MARPNPRILAIAGDSTRIFGFLKSSTSLKGDFYRDLYGFPKGSYQGFYRLL